MRRFVPVVFFGFVFQLIAESEYQYFYMLMNRKEVSLHVDKDDLRFSVV